MSFGIQVKHRGRHGTTRRRRAVMFENKNEKQAKEEILGLVKEYAERFHNQKKDFAVGQ